jgi:hypothetical protein
MTLDQPAKSFLFAQVVFNTENRRQTLQASQLQPSVSVNNPAVACDDDWLSEGSIPESRKSGQLGSRNRAPMAGVAGVRVEFI